MNRRQFIRTGGSLAAAAQLRSQTNEQIERDRNTALELLKPSARDLDYGTRLHQEALVFDAYGFSPRAAVDGDAVRTLAEEGASEMELQDQREDMTMTRAAIDEAERAEFVRAWNASGVTCLFQNCGEESNDPLRLIKRLARFTYLTDHLRGVLRARPGITFPYRLARSSRLAESGRFGRRIGLVSEFRRFPLAWRRALSGAGWQEFRW